MRKSILLLMLLSLLLSLMAVQAQDEVVTITWWATERGRDTAETRELHFQLARAFEEEHPNIQVAISLFPSRGFNTRVLTAIAAGGRS